MAKLYASWVHGTAVVPDRMGNPPLAFPDGGGSFSDVNGFRRGDGNFFRIVSNQRLWFHIPIPTPVLVEDRRATLGRVMALFRIDNGRLDTVQVTDGRNVILRLDNLDIAGDHSGGLDPGNTFDVNHDGIAFGVCFSLRFRGPEDPQTPDATADLIIVSAGGDFFHNI